MGDPDDHIESYRSTMDVYYLEEKYSAFSSQQTYPDRHSCATKAYQQKEYMILPT